MLNRQKLLEEEMITLGVKRYRHENTEAKKGKHESTTPAGIQFIRKGCGKIVKKLDELKLDYVKGVPCLLYTSPSPRDGLLSRMPSSA